MKILQVFEDYRNKKRIYLTFIIIKFIVLALIYMVINFIISYLNTS
jgi:hypothetical protein